MIDRKAPSMGMPATPPGEDHQSASKMTEAMAPPQPQAPVSVEPDPAGGFVLRVAPGASIEEAMAALQEAMAGAESAPPRDTAEAELGLEEGDEEV